MKIEIKKRSDGAGVLHCTRDDGSVTWQKQTPRMAAHFSLHDLTHYAVETTLGYRSGFYGLVSQGWEIDDTTGKGSRGSIPPEAGEVESIVGLFDSERAMGTPWHLDEFNQFAPRKLTEAQILAVRSKRSELFQLWSEVAPGASLDLVF